jgi:hypothetical protein
MGAVAVAIFLGVRQLGIEGDCAPNQIDGQCGMSTALGSFFGLVGAAVVMIPGTISTVISWRRRMRSLESHETDRPDA